MVERSEEFSPGKYPPVYSAGSKHLWERWRVSRIEYIKARMSQGDEAATLAALLGIAVSQVKRLSRTKI